MELFGSVTFLRILGCYSELFNEWDPLKEEEEEEGRRFCSVLIPQVLTALVESFTGNARIESNSVLPRSCMFTMTQRMCLHVS